MNHRPKGFIPKKSISFLSNLFLNPFEKVKFQKKKHSTYGSETLNLNVIHLPLPSNTNHHAKYHSTTRNIITFSPTISLYLCTTQ